MFGLADMGFALNAAAIWASEFAMTLYPRTAIGSQCRSQRRAQSLWRQGDTRAVPDDLGFAACQSQAFRRTEQPNSSTLGPLNYSGRLRVHRGQASR